MAAASLEGVWAKLARAQEHHDLLERELRDFIEHDPQPIGFSIPYLDAESRWHVCLAIARELHLRGSASSSAISSTTSARRSTTSSGSWSS